MIVKAPSFKNFVANNGLFDEVKTSSIFFMLLLFIIFSLPFLLMILPLIKTKAGLTLLQLVRIWGLLRFLKNSGRFNFNNMGSAANTQSISLDEAYKILNLNPKKKYSKEEVMKSYKNIMKKIHPDVSPDLSRLAAIVNEAKEIVLKDVS